MSFTILRRPDVEARVGLSRATIYAKMADGSFPKPIRLSERAVGWKTDDIDAWLAARPVASAA
jgi:prophage regulatory protein